jgi:hypothetical protein
MTEPLSYRASLAWTGQVFRQWRAWTAANWRKTLLLSALAFVVGWIWNTYIIAVNLEGSAVDPGQDTTATVDGHQGNALFWLLLFSLIAGLITYGWSRGWRAAAGDAAQLPRRLGQAVATNPVPTGAMLLWGAAVSLVLSTLISSAVSLALGLVLLALAATPIGVVLNFALIRLWRGLAGIVAPNAGARLGTMVSPFMVMIGEAVGLFLDWLIGNFLIGLVIGIVFAAASVFLIRAAPPRAAVLLFLAAATVGVQLIRMRGAYADDGGWSECVSSNGEPCSGIGGLFDWLGSPGAGAVVAQAAVGGVSAAAGAVIGVGVGGAAAGLAVAITQASRAGGTGQRPPTQSPSASDHPDPTARGGSVYGTPTGTPASAGGWPSDPGTDHIGGYDTGPTAHGTEQPGSGTDHIGGSATEQTAYGTEQTTYGTEQTAYGTEQTAYGTEQAGSGAEQVAGQPPPDAAARSGYLDGDVPAAHTGRTGGEAGWTPPETGPGADVAPSDPADIQDLLPEPPDRKKPEDGDGPGHAAPPAR